MDEITPTSNTTPVPNSGHQLAPGRSGLPAQLEPLPPSTELAETDCRALAVEEGFSRTAVDFAFDDGKWVVGQRLRTLLLAIPFIGVVILLFPTERFFRPPLQTVHDIALDDKVNEGLIASAGEDAKPMLRTRRRMEDAAERGDLPAALAIAREAIEPLSADELPEWREVHYRYWEYLERALSISELDRSLHQFRRVDPNDPIVTWYRARLFNHKVRSNQVDASMANAVQPLLRDLDVVNNRYGYQLEARPDAADAGEVRRRQQLIQLETARLHHALWKFGGYGENEDPSVAYRDKAITLCSAPNLKNDLDAQRLLVRIYDKILSQWWVFEFEEPINDKLMTKDQLTLRRSELEKSIREAEKKADRP